MTVLSRVGYIGLAKEVTQGTYVVPSFYIPATNITAEDVFMPLRDESYRNNDTLLQGLYQGPGDSMLGFDIHSYPDALPYLLRGVIGPDTVTPGVSTTLAANCAVNAPTIQLTASVPANSTIQISDASGANLEWVGISTVTGVGPFIATVTAPSTGTKFAHTAVGGSVLSQSTHSFKQSPLAAQVSYSLTKYDVALNAGATHTRGFPGCKIAELILKVDPKATVTAQVKWVGWLSATQPDPTATFSSYPPMLGWEWAMTNAGGMSTRGLTYDMTIKRQADAIHASTAAQNPREVFQGGLEVDGIYKAIFENDTDLNLYLQYNQLPATATLTQPATSGGSVLTLTASKSGWRKGAVDLSTVYVTAAFELSGIYNSTDTGAVAATLSNYVSAAY
jgi:hypothetical protein